MHKTSCNHPPLGFRKFNFDVAVEEDSGFLAVVARDHEGNVKAVQMKHILCSTLFEAKTFAVVFSLEMAVLKSNDNTIFKGDAVNVILAINCLNECLE